VADGTVARQRTQLHFSHVADAHRLGPVRFDHDLGDIFQRVDAARGAHQ
jgi:hypothetical protein